MTWTRSGALALALLLLTGAAVLGADRIGIIGDDNRVMLDSGQWPWSAVGRVNRTWGGYCTGTLVAPDVVLTAEHCLFDARTRRWIKPTELHFLAGYRRGGYLFHATVKRIVAPMTPPPRQGSVAAEGWPADDWALLVLNDAAAVAPIPVKALAEGKMAGGDGEPPRVMRAGYGQDRPYLLSLDDDCTVKAQLAEGRVLNHTCDALPGDSGSPLLVRSGEEVFVIGVTSGVAQIGTVQQGMAVGAAAFLAALRELDQPGAADDARPRN